MSRGGNTPGGVRRANPEQRRARARKPHRLAHARFKVRAESRQAGKEIERDALESVEDARRVDTSQPECGEAIRHAPVIERQLVQRGEEPRGLSLQRGRGHEEDDAVLGKVR